MVRTWGFQDEAPGLPEYWAGRLAEHEPISVVEVGSPVQAVVLIGFDGNGTIDGCTVTVTNPWRPNQGEVQNLDLAAFESDFELGSGTSRPWSPTDPRHRLAVVADGPGRAEARWRPGRMLRECAGDDQPRHDFPRSDPNRSRP